MSDETGFDWRQALAPTRLRSQKVPAKGDEGNEFLSDYTRVVFSSAFRRLQDKTQVSPLSETDFVRRRLTHSVEVAAVGERMGRVVAARLAGRLKEDYRESFGRIIATACLLHDIGNPPFGHEGELAIRDWALQAAANLPDYRCFDGNAQGFRIAVRLQNHGREHGMDLTAPILMSFLKYPRVPNMDDVARGKCSGASVMSSEEWHYNRLRDMVGLPPGRRHPLCLLVEAADDIVNRLVDIEDALKLGLISPDEIHTALDESGSSEGRRLLDVFRQRVQLIRATDGIDPIQRGYQHFRANCIISLAEACERAFEDRISEIEDGDLQKDLIRSTELAPLYMKLRELEYSKIFGDHSIVRIEAGGKAAVKGLLNIFLPEVTSASKLSDLVPLVPTFDDEESETDEVVSVRRVVDYISGMTDRYAIRLFQELSGVSL